MARELYADLDALASRTVSFKFQGVSYKIGPIDTINFMEFSNALIALQDLVLSEKTIAPDELRMKYTNLFKSVCSQITDDTVKAMEIPQVAAVFQLIVDSVLGRIQDEGLKKNFPTLTA